MTKNLRKFTLLLAMLLAVPSLAACNANRDNGPGIRGYENAGDFDRNRPMYDYNRPGTEPYAYRDRDGMIPYGNDYLPNADRYPDGRVTPFYDDRFPDRDRLPFADDGNNMRLNGNMADVNGLDGLAQRMANAADRVKGVKKATVLIRGNDVVIGIDVNNRQNAQAIERQVAQTVNRVQPGFNIHVTSDKRLHQRIQAMREQNNNDNWRPRAWGDDFADLIRDIRRTVTAPIR
ncbi:hypothetical protein BSNK01_01790 [Bacillaceae bacterium]